MVFDAGSRHVEGERTDQQTVVLRGKRHAATSNHFAVLVDTLG